MKRVIIAIVLYIYEGWEDHGLHSVSWRIRKVGWSQFEGLRVRGASVVSPSQSPKIWEPGEPNVSEQEKRMSHSSKERKFALLLPFCSNQVINRLDEKCSYQLGWSFLGCCCCSVTKSCLTLCDPMDCSMPGLPAFHHLPEHAQTHVH